MSSRSVTIVGGGIIGAASAHYLAKDGWTVTLVDSGLYGSACSHGNCGLFAPSHSLPLAAPGAIKEALKMMAKPDSPFYIKPRLDIGLFHWFYQFAKQCRTGKMLRNGAAIHSLILSSSSLYAELMRLKTINCEWESKGNFFIYRHKKELDAVEETNKLMADHFHVEAQRINSDELLEREPSLLPNVCAEAWFYPGDCHLRPDKLLNSWRTSLENEGVRIVEKCPVSGFVIENAKVRAVTTDAGEIESDAVVIATGAWTPAFERDLGCKIPIQPGKGYSITMSRPKLCPSRPLIFDHEKVVVTPFQTGYRIGSTLEFSGYNDTMNRRRLTALVRGAQHYLREPLGNPVEEEWCGWRPMTYDSKPIISFSPKLKNVVIAAGHSKMGITQAPATGKLVSEMLSGSKPHIDPSPFSVSRFN